MHLVAFYFSTFSVSWLISLLKLLFESIVVTYHLNFITFFRYTIFDSKQMPPIAQPPSHNPLLMQQPQPMANAPSGSSSSMHNPLSPPQMDVLSVSSKKLCSYCTHELGSGAAMIIENLGLFYHIFCFKCSVCHIPISDGNIHGTDVRVRNSRLHCQNCFSNEEGVKFSCVWLINVGFCERQSLALMITELRELIFSILSLPRFYFKTYVT